MPIILIFGASFIVALSGAIAPGPLLALTISQTTRYGFSAGPLLVLGHGILELGVVIALAKGLSEVIGSNLISGVIGIVGGLVMLGMGFIILRQVLGRALVLSAQAQQASQAGPLVLGGIIASLSNPYWVIWWATIGATYIAWLLRQGAWGIVSFYLGHISADLAWYSLVSLVVASGRRKISPTGYKYLLTGCGVFLFGFGLYFIASGVNLLKG